MLHYRSERASERTSEWSKERPRQMVQLVRRKNIALLLGARLHSKISPSSTASASSANERKTKKNKKLDWPSATGRRRRPCACAGRAHKWPPPPRENLKQLRRAPAGTLGAFLRLHKFNGTKTTTTTSARDTRTQPAPLARTTKPRWAIVCRARRRKPRQN